ncbi:MAG: ArgE/DapE family deacylase [Patescibacteria group bacterium]
MNKIYKLSVTEKNLLINLLRKLVAADTTNPPGNEDRVVKIVEAFLKKLKVKSRVYRKARGRGNILWSLGSKKLPEVFIAAHADTVPAGGPRRSRTTWQGWKTNPFKLVHKNGKLIGRGVVDNKSPLAGMLLATKILQKLESELPVRVTFAAIADEERGNQFGLNYLVQRKIVNPAAAIIPDGCGNNRLVEIAEKGTVHLKVIAYGKQGHGSMPEQSKNAIYVLKDFLRQVRKLKFTKQTKLLTPATISVGMIQAGSAPNIIPGEAEAHLDLRYPPNESKSAILKKLKDLADREKKKWKVRPFKFEILADLPASETAAQHPLVQSTLSAIRKATRKKPRATGMPAFSLAGVLRSRGVPVAVFGPGDLEECHRSNEKIKEREVYEFTEVLVELLKKLEI